MFVLFINWRYKMSANRVSNVSSNSLILMPLPRPALPQKVMEQIYAFSQFREVAALQNTCAWLKNGWEMRQDNAFVHSGPYTSRKDFDPTKGKIEPSRIQQLHAERAHILVLDLFDFHLRDLRNLFRPDYR